MKRSELKAGKPLARKSAMKRASVKPKETKPPKGPKPKKCANRACRAPYMPDPKRPFKNWCSDDCALVIAMDKLQQQKAKKERQERAQDKIKREAMKGRTDWIKDAQTAFNAFIRFRDRDLPCICCGATDSAGAGGVGGGWDAGHYISRGHASHLRFDERNVHKQRKGCNRPGGTTRARYRVGLIARIGEESVRELEALEYAPVERKWSVDELKAIKAHYVAKLRELQQSSL